MWVDAWALEHLLEKIDAAVAKDATTSLDALPRLADKILTLYRGHFLGHASPGTEAAYRSIPRG